MFKRNCLLPKKNNGYRPQANRNKEIKYKTVENLGKFRYNQS